MALPLRDRTSDGIKSQLRKDPVTRREVLRGLTKSNSKELRTTVRGKTPAQPPRP